MIKSKFIFISIFLCCIFYPPFSFGERVEGPGYIKFTLQPQEQKTFRINLKVNVVHRFIGVGKGGIVNYYVYDGNGRKIAHDMEIGSDCNIEFTPKLPGLHYFTAKNWGDDSSEIEIRTN